MRTKNHNWRTAINKVWETIKTAFEKMLIAIRWISVKSKTKNGWQVIHWFVFGFALSLLPLLLAIGQDCSTVKMTIAEILDKYSTDFLLVVFAVSVNMGACTITYSEKPKIGRFALSIFAMMYCLFWYTHLHHPNTELLDGALGNIFKGALVCLIINTIAGILLQIIPAKGSMQ